MSSIRRDWLLSTSLHIKNEMQILWNPISSRLNVCWQIDWAIEDEAKNLSSAAHPYDQQAFSPPDPTAKWHSHLALVTYIFAVFNFGALAQASDFRIERRQVVFLCWMQIYKPRGSLKPNFQQTECLLTNKIKLVDALSIIWNTVHIPLAAIMPYKYTCLSAMTIYVAKTH